MKGVVRKLCNANSHKCVYLLYQKHDIKQHFLRVLVLDLELRNVTFNELPVEHFCIQT